MLWDTVSLMSDFIQWWSVLREVADPEIQGKYKFVTVPGELGVLLGDLG